MNLVEPPLDARLIDDCYACRRGRGTHRAVDRYQDWARRYAYAMKLDVRRYFPSIDHLLLKDCLERRIKDRGVLGLLYRIIDSAPECAEPQAPFPGDDLLTPLERPRGIPIGNLTSQFFANLFLDDFDHWVKQGLRCPAAQRDLPWCSLQAGMTPERGGSWNNEARFLRAPARNRNTPSNRNNNLGERLASPPVLRSRCMCGASRCAASGVTAGDQGCRSRFGMEAGPNSVPRTVAAALVAGRPPANGPPPPMRSRPHGAESMSAVRLFQITLALVLWYFLAGLTFSRVLGVWPPGYEAEGFFLTGAALPWSLLALGFYLPTDSHLGAVVRDLLFFGLIAGGIAINAVIVHGIARTLLAQVRLALRLRRARRARR
jgi:hypothetical protein